MNLPERPPTMTIDVDLPLPLGYRFGQVEINGKPRAKFDSVRNAVSVSGLSGNVRLLVTLK